MNDDLRQPTDHALSAVIPPELRSLAGRLPAAAFTASVLFDVLSLVADGPEHALSYSRRAMELLTVGIGASLATLGLSLTEALNTPPSSAAGMAATRRAALDGAVVAVYLLDVAARQKHVAGGFAADAGADSGAIGLSLAGLALLGVAGKLD